MARTNGYIQEMVGGKPIYQHRLVWEAANGKIPKGMVIDHINNVRDDNRLSNLRLVTTQQNHFNRRGVSGFTWVERKKRFRAYIYLNGKHNCLGYHRTILDARASYLRAKSEVHSYE